MRRVVLLVAALMGVARGALPELAKWSFTTRDTDVLGNTSDTVTSSVGGLTATLESRYATNLKPPGVNMSLGVVGGVGLGLGAITLPDDVTFELLLAWKPGYLFTPDDTPLFECANMADGMSTVAIRQWWSGVGVTLEQAVNGVSVVTTVRADDIENNMSPQLGKPTGASDQISQGEYYHIVVTLTAATSTTSDDGTITVYLDGNVIKTLTQAPTLLQTQRSECFLGRGVAGSDPAFDGIISLFNIYASAASATEVAALYSAYTIGPTSIAPGGALAFGRPLAMAAGSYVCWMGYTAPPTTFPACGQPSQNTDVVTILSTQVCSAISGSSVSAATWSDATLVYVAGTECYQELVAEVQQFSVDADSGTFTISFAGATSSQITVPASASDIASALGGLSNIGSSAVSVEDVTAAQTGLTSSTVKTYQIKFEGFTVEGNVAEISVNDAALISPGQPPSSVTTLTQGSDTLVAVGDTIVTPRLETAAPTSAPSASAAPSSAITPAPSTAEPSAAGPTSAPSASAAPSSAITPAPSTAEPSAAGPTSAPPTETPSAPGAAPTVKPSAAPTVSLLTFSVVVSATDDLPRNVAVGTSLKITPLLVEQNRYLCVRSYSSGSDAPVNVATCSGVGTASTINISDANTGAGTSAGVRCFPVQATSTSDDQTVYLNYLDGSQDMVSVIECYHGGSKQGEVGVSVGQPALTTYIGSPPQALSAEYDAHTLSLLVTFDRTTDEGKNSAAGLTEYVAGSTWPCVKVLTDTSFATSYCSWDSAMKLRMYYSAALDGCVQTRASARALLLFFACLRISARAYNTRYPPAPPTPHHRVRAGTTQRCAPERAAVC